MKPIAIYIHIPFCARKCKYCDFASYSGKEGLRKEYFKALHAEIESRKDMLRTREVRSVFFGGGTPSLGPAEDITEMMEHVFDIINPSENIEITMEANPGTLTVEKLKTYRSAGINRLSIGVQSLNTKITELLGRIHDPETARRAIVMAADAGFDNINADLMYAIPGQTMAQWKGTLTGIMELPVSHVSAYSLIIEEGTDIHRQVEEGILTPADDDTVVEMQRIATALLRSHGFERYEISNYARQGCESKHNIAYWTDMDYLGIGSSAHSMVDNVRFHNPNMIEDYIFGKRELEWAERTEQDHMEEVLMLATRMVRGLDLQKWSDTFGRDFGTMFAKPINKLENYGLVEVRDGFLTLTEPGLELQDSVVLELMEVL